MQAKNLRELAKWKNKVCKALMRGAFAEQNLPYLRLSEKKDNH